MNYQSAHFSKCKPYTYQTIGPIAEALIKPKYTLFVGACLSVTLV